MTVFLFPGQGAQEPAMCDAVRRHPQFHERYQTICDLVQTDVLRELAAGRAEMLNQNRFSSLLTVLVGTLALELFKQHSDVEPAACAGYSVGQWAAMHAAGMIGYEAMIAVLVERARLMDEYSASEPGGMCAVIGLKEAELEALLERLRLDGFPVFISNYNCLGQYSIAGTLPAIGQAMESIAALRPKKLLQLPVSGAWHCPLLKTAESGFERYLQGVALGEPRIPVIDNVTGESLPVDGDLLRRSLSRHLSHPVQWSRGIKQLIAGGCTQFIEFGHGSQLSKFGFFIDRDADFRGWRA
ncbi:hypothetical protein BI347_14870 [Chromobacterium sphagni]|uniref:[acyl-carrier-protein] S-malonyltransferase n=1 Tax=Chromobacterium sphagni TaxID=1903179 RepID=A0A1S1X589_9NEIS|nr:ACP S-malonyltransferase [Chromobacterium sphagni]OHX14648.1 hypothetical protein BI347_14870 [Chromobacterium sphagni]